jgi:hypothetical protein
MSTSCLFRNQAAGYVFRSSLFAPWRRRDCWSMRAGPQERTLLRVMCLHAVQDVV